MKQSIWVYCGDQAFSINELGAFLCYDKRVADPLSTVGDWSVPEEVRNVLIEDFHRLNSIDADRKEMCLWVDDVRLPPKGYNLWAKTADEAVRMLEAHHITKVSLDHDLADVGRKSEETGYTVALHIEELAHVGGIRRMKWSVHSANPVGIQKIKAAMESAEKGWEKNERRSSSRFK